MASGDELECHCQPKRIASVKRCSPENPHLSIRKLVGLVGNPISANLYDRHVIILNDFLDACKYGFWVQDLPYLMRLIELLVKQMDKVCPYRKPLELLLSLCELPPMLIKTSEALAYSRDIQEYFSFLGYLLIWLQEDELQDLVFRALEALLNRKVHAAICRITLKMCYNAVETSEFPKIITQLMEVADENLYKKLLDVALILVNISPIVCQKMINGKAMNHLLVRLDPLSKTRNLVVPFPHPEEGSAIQHFDTTSKLLWTLLDAFKRSTDEFRTTISSPNLRALWSLRCALHILTKEKGSEINRNQIMGILLQFIDLFPDMALHQSGLADDIAILSTATEVGTNGTWASEVCFTTSEIDYEYKKMLLLALCYCAKKSNVLKKQTIIPALLNIITPKSNTPWHSQQQSKLISLTLHTLQVLAPQLSKDFCCCDGPGKLLVMVDYYNIEPYDLRILQDCLKSLCSISSSGNKSILQNLIIHDALNILRTLSENLLSSESLILIVQRCLAYTFSTLEALYHAQHACLTSTVNLVMKLLKRIANPNLQDPIFDPKFIICAIGFLWEGIVWCETNLKIFVSLGGVFTFLDIIQKSVYPVKVVALGALVDMCDEGSCVPHLITWRKGGQKLLSMLLQLFRDENLKLGVKTAPNGVIGDIELPVMGQQQWYETFRDAKESHTSPATVDLLGSCRPKVYALIQLLNGRHEVRVELINEHYCMYDYNNLNIQDQLTLLLAENFLALKLGEAWVEISKDTEKTGIRPLAVDEQMISLLKHRFYTWTLHLKILQEALLAKETEKECINERILYNTLKDSKLAESLKALHELDYISRTTERMFRLVRKMTQTSEQERSLAFSEGADHHRTCLHMLKVNPVFGQSVSIQSNIIVDPNSKDANLRPVSPENDEVTLAEPGDEVEILSPKF